MRKATVLLSMLMIGSLLLPAAPAYAAQAPETEPPAEIPAGTVYTVAAGSAQPALTVVDLQFDGDGATESGVQFDGGSRYYYGAVIRGVTYGAVVDSAGAGYFGSSSGTIPLYGPKGNMTGVVWGDCRPTEIQCQTGFLLRGDVEDSILVDDGTAVTALDAIVRYEGGSSRLVFHNAALSSDSGVLLTTSEDAAGQVSLSFHNGAYEGALDVRSPDAALYVLVGSGALLHGHVAAAEDMELSCAEMTVASGGTWAPSDVSRLTRLQVDEGASVYASIEDDQGVLTVSPGGEPLEPGVYEAAIPLTETLPFGHGPAVGEEEQAPAPEDALTDELPFGRGPDVEPNTDAEEQDVPADEADVPAAEPAPSPDLEIGTTAAAASDALGLSLAVRLTESRLSSLLSADALADGVLAHIAILPQPPVAGTLRAALTNSHSFLTETLDKQTGILYNPYCCLAA